MNAKSLVYAYIMNCENTHRILILFIYQCSDYGAIQHIRIGTIIHLIKRNTRTILQAICTI